MNRIMLIAALLTSLSGCATIVNDHEQAVLFTSAEPGARFTVTNQDGHQVAGGVTPATRVLPAAAGYFDGERYTVQSGRQVTVLDSEVSGWYWVGAILTVTGALLVDPVTGDMYQLPDSVEVVK